MQPVEGKVVTVAGLGRFGGGVAVARWLARQGARVLVTDRDGPEKLADSIQQLDGEPIEFRLGEHQFDDFTRADLVVASPAIPPSSPYLQAAAAAGVPVTTEIRLFVERCPASIVGVTGTKGKSTTASMLGRMLATRYTTHLGGNIGVSLLEKLPTIAARDIVVLELSSFMLEYLGRVQWSPAVAVVTMVGADHLDWHGSREAYVAAKTNIVRFQKPSDVAVLCGQDAGASALSGICQETGATVVQYRAGEAIELKVPGAHNRLNAAGAMAAANVLGVGAVAAANAVRDFDGLPHRLRLVHTARGVRYYDDSIATIPESAIAALESFPPRTVIQIVGGYDAKADLELMCRHLAGRAKAVLCIGATGAAIAAMVRAKGSPDTTGCGVHECGDLASAVGVAQSLAGDGDVVLLSPGCKSYDQFVNFEKRGDDFSQLAIS
jgi:UDP-N-acetylmuramoylalanine--D-glutamate ligase